jgi:uncharacterized protein (TIGR00251 family)
VVAEDLRLISIRESNGVVTFAVRIQPRAKKDAITGEFGDALKVSLTAPPIDGRANEACVEFFAKLLKVPRSSVTIASGQSSRNKVIRVAGLTAEQLRERLG